jgi:hypothetical protein
VLTKKELRNESSCGGQKQEYAALNLSMKKRRRRAGKPSTRGIRGLYPALLVILCFAAYANSLIAEFVWDDQFQVVRNETIRSFSNLPKAFTTSLWSFMSSEGGAPSGTFNRYYRPVQSVIYMLAYQIGGLQPSIFHFLNITLSRRFSSTGCSLS